MRVLALAISALLLAGCGGGDPEDFADIEQAPRAAMAAPAVKVMEWGDSTAAGSQLSNGSSPSFEAQKTLTRMGYNFQVKHEAVGGMPAVYLLNGRHPLHRDVPFPQFPSLAWADIGVVRSGINEGRLGYTQEQFRSTLQTLVDIHRAAGKVIVLVTPSPMDPAVIGPQRVAYVEASAKTVRQVVSANPDVAVLCDQNRFAKWSGIVTWKVDGLHPNEEATRAEGKKKARCILNAASLLRR